MQIVEASVAVLTTLSVIFFLLYVVSLVHAPTGERPRTPVYSALGEPLPAEENPGYKETEDEDH